MNAHWPAPLQEVKLPEPYSFLPTPVGITSLPYSDVAPVSRQRSVVCLPLQFIMCSILHQWVCRICTDFQPFQLSTFQLLRKHE